MNEYELYHWGIRGMKWGVRRYQNPDGSLTEEGKRRYRVDANGNYVKRSISERKVYNKKVKAAKAAELAKRNRSPRDKKINELTDKQLEKYITRMQNEKRAYELFSDVNRLNPKPVSRGKKFIDNLWARTIEPVIYEQGRNYLNKLIKDAMNAQENANKKESDRRQKELDEAKRQSQYWTNMANAENQKQKYKELIKNREKE